ncbi:MAG TPA: hypothetical protein VN963_09830 [bacterium]|nr:hypothetical protein [bacterium]
MSIEKTYPTSWDIEAFEAVVLINLGKDSQTKIKHFNTFESAVKEQARYNAMKGVTAIAFFRSHL